MTKRTLESEISGTGQNQGDIYRILANIVDLITELQDDHATMRTEVVAIGTTLANIKTIYDAHTHKLPATPAEDENTSAPDTTAATGSKAPGAASAITDTSGSSVPATLTNSTNLVLTGG